MSDDKTTHVLMLNAPAQGTHEGFLAMLDSYIHEHSFAQGQMQRLFDKHGKVPETGEDEMMFYVLQGYSEILDERIGKIVQHFGLEAKRTEEVQHGKPQKIN